MTNIEVRYIFGRGIPSSKRWTLTNNGYVVSLPTLIGDPHLDLEFTEILTRLNITQDDDGYVFGSFTAMVTLYNMIVNPQRIATPQPASFGEGCAYVIYNILKNSMWFLGMGVFGLIIPATIFIAIFGNRLSNVNMWVVVCACYLPYLLTYWLFYRKPRREY